MNSKIPESNLEPTKELSSTAVKLVPSIKVVPKSPSTDDRHKDEDDEPPMVSTALIETALNGFMITVTYEDGTEEKSVHPSVDEVLEVLRTLY